MLHKGVGGQGRDQGCVIFIDDVEVGTCAVVFVFPVRVSAIVIQLGGPLPQPVDRQISADGLVGGDAEVGFAPLLDGGGGLAGNMVRKDDLTGDGEVAAVYLIATPVVEILCREEYAATIISRAIGRPVQHVEDFFRGATVASCHIQRPCGRVWACRVGSRGA